jgi:dTDP-4-amino-4,6-dideoxygalactose transaminase
MQMEVKFLDLRFFYQQNKQDLDEIWQNINNSGIYLLGQYLEKFEYDFAKYTGVKHAVGVAHGLDALKLALRANNIKQGDEFLVPVHTYIATWLAVSEEHAIPVPVDMESDTYLLDAQKLEASISSKTKAIIPVHLYGKVCDMEKINQIAKKYNLVVIEDAAQSHGAKSSADIKAGALGACGAFSFYPGKNLGCFGDGGCITTNDSSLYENLRKLRNYGGIEKYQHDILGVNSRLSEIQSAVLSLKLKYLDKWNQIRQEQAKLYIEELKNLSSIILPIFNEKDVWHLFVIRTEQREKLQKYLHDNNIQTNIHYPKPIFAHKAYSFMNIDGDSFKRISKYSEEFLSLPIGPHLSENQILFCIDKIKSFDQSFRSY